MEFGVHLLTGYPFGTDCDVQAGIYEVAKAAESLGFDCVWVNDNVVLPDESLFRVRWKEICDDTFFISPLITLASLIHLTPKIDLGVAVLVLPQRNVFVVAKQVASLDILSNGRLRLGVGVGWREDEFNLLGADFANRGDVADEAIQVMRTLWENDSASFEGKFHHFQKASIALRPTSGGPPIWIGANTPPALRRAARFGDAWLSFALSVDELRAGANQLRQLRQDRPIPTLALETGIRIYREGQDPPRSLPEYSFPLTLAGYPDQIIEKLKAYQEVGLEHFLCIFYVDKLQDQLEQMRIFAEQVMPHFSDAG